MGRYLGFLNGIQALRRRTAALGIGMGGALGVAADPLPHQLATVRRILGNSHIRHLISDEVGLGKTVQALMIVNALRWQNPVHRTLVIVPDNLLSQWQTECWVRGHVMPAIAGVVDENNTESASITLARPQDLLKHSGQAERTINADPAVFDLLIVDEPQTMSRDVIEGLLSVTDDFMQLLILSATPGLGDQFWCETILRMIEPEAVQLANIQGQTLDKTLEERESTAIAAMRDHDDPAEWTVAFLQAGIRRRVIRNGRADCNNDLLPRRRNHEIRIQPLMSERLRYDIADMILEHADPEQGIQQGVWTTAKALQRTGRAARNALAGLVDRGGTLGKLAEEARAAMLADPGNSRLDALLDILSEQWEKDKDKKFIIVCGDNPSIDMLQTALPRYFPDLAEEISVMRRPATTDVDGITNLREFKETLDPLLSGHGRLLLVGDWVQAGLNLHHVAHGIIFFSLPWEIDAIDQLIGRLDRLGKASPHKKRHNIDIWRIIMVGSQEAAISDVAAAYGVFEAPLPPLSAEELRQRQALLGQAAIRRSASHVIKLIENNGMGLPTRFSAADPYTKDRAIAEYKRWCSQPCPQPEIVIEDAASLTPVQKEENNLDGWLRIISKSGDFDIGWRKDCKDPEYEFNTIWYHRRNPKIKTGDGPFPLPGVSNDNWMSFHAPFIYRRSRISFPPRQGVFTDAGEQSARPLHFLDHGSKIHDALVNGYMGPSLKPYAEGKTLVQAVVSLPEKHPIKTIGSTILLTCAHIDPFPDDFLPSLWTSSAGKIFDKASSEKQQRDLTADRRALGAFFRSVQRRIRLETPAQMLRVGSARKQGEWYDLSSDEVDICLRPLIKKQLPLTEQVPQLRSVFEEESVTKVIRARHVSKINSDILSYNAELLCNSQSSIKCLSLQIAAHYSAQIRNRKLVLKRRMQSSSDGIPVELLQGQIAALERLVCMAQLNSAEAREFLNNFLEGQFMQKSVNTYSIIVRFIS